jgi:hypothetical protein
MPRRPRPAHLLAVTLTRLDTLQGAARVLRTHPMVWLSALLVTALLAAAGVAGVYAAANAERAHRLETARGEGMRLLWAVEPHQHFDSLGACQDQTMRLWLSS